MTALGRVETVAFDSRRVRAVEDSKSQSGQEQALGRTA